MTEPETLEVEQEIRRVEDLNELAYHEIGEVLEQLVGASDTVGRYSGTVRMTGTLEFELVPEENDG